MKIMDAIKCHTDIEQSKKLAEILPLESADMFYAGVKCGHSWSEKQSEQKSADKVEPKDYCSIDPHFFKTTDKVEPKFKVGDWVIGRATHNEPRQIAEVTKEGYKTAYGGWYGFSWEEDMHLWTIEDAKDGDILSWDDSKCIALFKNIYDDVSFNSYGFVGHCTGKFETRPTFHDIEGAHPATKEQRDTLMKAMADAGYTFDFKKKELKEIYVIDEDKSEMDYCFTKMMNGEKVSPIWSDDDENEMNHILSVLEDKQKEQEEKGYNNLINTDKWLKSLKHRYTWKPSDEQMEAIKDAIEFLGCTKKVREDLKSLYEQLQKLKG